MSTTMPEATVNRAAPKELGQSSSFLSAANRSAAIATGDLPFINLSGFGVRFHCC
jgi:hypothetical protein